MISLNFHPLKEPKIKNKPTQKKVKNNLKRKKNEVSSNLIERK